VSPVTATGATPAERLEQYRRELIGYCYRMLGSIHEAEDAVQATMLRAGDPAERMVSLESVRLAFIAALQHLTPRQRAVLILRDVLRWRAAEVAVLLETSVDAVNSALRRARAALAAVDRDSAPSPPTADDRELLVAYIDAFERSDVDALVRLLRDDAILEMPPFELWMQGPDDIRRWLLAVDAFGQELLTPVNANGSLAVAVYRTQAPGAPPTAFSVQVLDTIAGRISAIHVFLEPALFELFGLPVDPVS